MSLEHATQYHVFCFSFAIITLHEGFLFQVYLLDLICESTLWIGRLTRGERSSTAMLFIIKNSSTIHDPGRQVHSYRGYYQIKYNACTPTILRRVG